LVLFKYRGYYTVLYSFPKLLKHYVVVIFSIISHLVSNLFFLGPFRLSSVSSYLNPLVSYYMSLRAGTVFARLKSVCLSYVTVL